MTMLGGRKVNAKGRATGRLKTNRHTQFKGQFAGRLIEMLESPAFRVLSLSGRRILDRLEIELGRHGGQDNGRLPCTYQDFCDYGIDRHAIAPAIRECVALGFIELSQRGSGGNAEFRSPNYFRLTYKHSGSEPPSDEWRKIETLELAESCARAARGATTKQNARHRCPMGKTPTEISIATTKSLVPQKPNSDGDFSPFSMGKTHTESAAPPMGETPTTVPVWETLTTSRSGDGALGTPTAAPKPSHFVYPELPDCLNSNRVNP
jgi:hypothetical protein